MSAPTPGPWVLEKCLGENDLDCGWSVEQAQAQTRPYRGNICRVDDAEHIGGITIAERDANALLIAAAPELLEALQRVVEAAAMLHPFHLKQAIGRARAAINKAGGAA